MRKNTCRFLMAFLVVFCLSVFAEESVPSNPSAMCPDLGMRVAWGALSRAAGAKKIVVYEPWEKILAYFNGVIPMPTDGIHMDEGFPVEKRLEVEAAVFIGWNDMENFLKKNDGKTKKIPSYSELFEYYLNLCINTTTDLRGQQEYDDERKYGFKRTQSEDLRHGRTQESMDPDRAWKKNLCIAKGMQVAEFFKYKKQGTDRDALLNDHRIEGGMTDEQKMEVLGLIQMVYAWDSNPKQLVDKVFADCLGVK